MTYPPDNAGNLVASISGASGSADVVGYKDEVQVVNNTNRLNDTQNRYLSVLVDNRVDVPGFGDGGAISPYNSGKLKSYAVGQYLSPSEMVTFSQIINSFQTSLGRNNY